MRILILCAALFACGGQSSNQPSASPGPAGSSAQAPSSATADEPEPAPVAPDANGNCPENYDLIQGKCVKKRGVLRPAQ